MRKSTEAGLMSMTGTDFSPTDALGFHNIGAANPLKIANFTQTMSIVQAMR
jgi:hypothetical protein